MNPDLQLTPQQLSGSVTLLADMCDEPGPEPAEVKEIRGRIQALMGALATRRRVDDDPEETVSADQADGKRADAPRKGIPRSRFKHPHQLIFG